MATTKKQSPLEQIAAVLASLDSETLASVLDSAGVEEPKATRGSKGNATGTPMAPSQGWPVHVDSGSPNVGDVIVTTTKAGKAKDAYVVGIVVDNDGDRTGIVLTSRTNPNA